MARAKSVDSEICIVENCEKPSKAKGLCSTHHQRQYRSGSVELGVIGVRRPRIKKKELQLLQRECRAFGCNVMSVELGLCKEHLVEFQLDHLVF